MWRYLGTFLLIASICGILGCPQPIQDSTGTTTVRIDRSDDETGAERGTDALEPDDGALEPNGEDVVEPGDVDAGAGDAPVASDGMEDSDEPASPADEDAGVEHAVDDDAAVGEAEPAEDVDADGGAGEKAVADADDDWKRGALDPERMMGSAKPLRSERPAARVSEDSLAFAGQWDVVVLIQDGRAALVEYDDAWSFVLMDDGTCTVRQSANGEIWEQSGGWELLRGELSLMLGPGGRRSYGMTRHADNFAVLSDPEGDAVLFMVRDDGDGPRPSVARSYSSDFGELKLHKSGQQYYKGTYGEPEGSLLLRKLQGFLVGSWEQSPAQGFVVIELTDGGFSGWWWYEGSLDIDGEWRGSVD
jgi:hypothetical protein